MTPTPLADEGVELWLAPVAPSYPATQLAAFEKVLDSEERARWQRFRFEEDRQRFLVGRAFMRGVLADRLGRGNPAALRFARPPHGKPELAGPDAGLLHFNLSHTDALLVLALSRRQPVGVDVEALSRTVELLALAQRYFAAPEYAALLAMEGSAQREHFFALWTLKEAWLKARGLGLRVPLDAFSFDLAGTHPRIDCAALLADADPGAWQFRLFQHGQFRIALAVMLPAEQALQVHVREWVP